MKEAVSLNASFKDTLECPICCELFTPPVFLCSNGHSLCAFCKERSRVCPICRVDFPSASAPRNTVVEEMLNHLSIKCKYEGCSEIITVGKRHDHYRLCPFNNFIRCTVCGSYEEDLVRHLIDKHEYKEISMDAKGGLRSFSGPYDSWTRDTEWPKGIWKFGTEATVVHAKSCQEIFHVYLYRISKEPLCIALSIKVSGETLSFRGRIPHISEQQDKASLPHFNCDVNMILQNYVKVHEEDEEILRLWVKVKKVS